MINPLIQTVVYQQLIRMMALTLAAEVGSPLPAKAVPGGHAKAPGTAAFDSRNAEQDNVYQLNPQCACVMAMAGLLKAPPGNVSFLGWRDLPHRRQERRALFRAATASTSQMLDERHLLRIIRTSVFAENVMKPDRRLSGVSFLP